MASGLLAKKNITGLLGPAGSESCLACDERRLIMVLTFAGCRLLVAVLHAPSAYGTAPDGPPREEVVAAWWGVTGKVLRAAVSRAAGAALVLYIDANGRLGSVTSPAIGPCEAQEEDYNGGRLHELALEHDLFVPATFMGGGPTWRSQASGAWHRIDYVLLPAEWRDILLSCDAPEDFPFRDVGQEDHRLVRV